MKVFFDDDLRMGVGHGRLRWGDTAGGCFCEHCVGGFRAYLHGSDMATDHDDRLDANYSGTARLRPIHAALRLMAGRGDEHCDKALMSRFLWRVACSGGDWRTVCDQLSIPAWVAAPYTETALRHLWAIWQRDALDTAREVA